MTKRGAPGVIELMAGRAVSVLFPFLAAATTAVTLGISCARVCDPADFTCNDTLAATLFARPIVVPLSGRMMILAGGSTAGTLIYDPTFNTFTRGADMPGVVTTGTQTLTVPSGVYKGRTIVLVGGGTGDVTFLYDPSASTFSTGPSFTTGIPGAGGNNFAVEVGSKAGRTLVIHGGGSTATSLFDPSTALFSAGPLLTGPAGAGSFSFTPTTGIYAGMTIVVHAGSSPGTSIFDAGSGTFFPGPILNGAPLPFAGTKAVLIPQGNFAGSYLFAHGQSSLTTQLFLPASGSFQIGPTLAQTLTSSPPAFPIQSGPAAGQILFCSGGSTLTTTRYIPSAHAFITGTGLPAAAGDHTPFFRRVDHGIDMGQTIMLRMGAPNGSVIHMESSDTFAVFTFVPLSIDTGNATFALP